jgi:hypothetical protein
MSTLLDPATVKQDSRRVEFVRVVAHTQGAVGPNTSENHWSIFLLLADALGSIRIVGILQAASLDAIR